MHRFWSSVMALSLVFGTPVHAQQLTLPDLAGSIRQAHRDGNATYRLEIDNDSLLLQDDDGFYSSGARLNVLYAARSGDRLLANGWHIGQEIYTPSNIKLSRPKKAGPPERPYAGWMYAGFVHHVHLADGSSRSLGLDIGCLGPCAGGEWTQKQLHRLIDQPQPRGWNRQVGNEAGLVLHAQVDTSQWRPSRWFDTSATLQARFGNIFTDAGATATARFGRLNRLPDEPTLHGLFRLGGRLVGYDATLQGGFFSGGDSHTVSPKRGVLEGEVGVAWQAAPFAASFSVVRRGSEIQNLPTSVGAQNFVRLQMSYTPG